MSEIQLIGTDLDGTLIGRIDEFDVYPFFREKIHQLKQTSNTVWAITTGRSMSSLRSVLRPMSSVGILPDFIIAKHAYIYGLTRWGYWPHIMWNVQTRNLVWRTGIRSRHLLLRCHELILSRFRRVKTICASKDRVTVRFSDKTAVTGAAQVAREIVGHHRHIQVFQYRGELDMRLIPFTKGIALAELARKLDILTENILAIGDGHNDISMLDKAVAAMTGCPANAKTEVMQAVHYSHGHIASQPVLSGTLDVINAHANDMVQSELPPNWEQTLSMRERRTDSQSQPHKPKSLVSTQTIVVFVIADAIAILALARFGVLGPVSSVIWQPVQKVISVFARLTATM